MICGTMPWNITIDVKRHILPALILTLFLGASPLRADPLADMGVVTPRVRLPAPDVLLPILQGGEESLNRHRGKVVLLHFWATWCVSCRKELPSIQRLWSEYADKDLLLLGINVDRGNRQGVASFVREMGLDFPTLLDASGKVRNAYEIFALPTTYIIGRDGKIVGRIIGERDWSGEKAHDLIRYLLTF